MQQAMHRACAPAMACARGASTLPMAVTRLAALHTVAARSTPAAVASAAAPVAVAAAPHILLTLHRYPPAFFPSPMPSTWDERNFPFLPRAPAPADRPSAAHGSVLAVRAPARTDAEEGPDRRGMMVRVTKYGPKANTTSCFVVALDDPLRVLCRELATHLGPAATTSSSTTAASSLPTISFDAAPSFLRALGMHRLRGLSGDATVRSLLSARGPAYVHPTPTTSLVFNSALPVRSGEASILRSNFKLVFLFATLVVTVASQLYYGWEVENRNRDQRVQERLVREKELQQQYAATTASDSDSATS